MIIETTDNRFYRVSDLADPNLAHCWWGIAVKKVRGAFIPKKHARLGLVRKDGSRVVQVGA